MAKVIKDNTIPMTSKRIITGSGKHKFIVEPSGYTTDKSYDIFHSDDCTLNLKLYESTVNGCIKRALAECETLKYYYENANREPFGEVEEVHDES